MLPLEIETIIHEYAEEMSYFESLPEPRAIQELVRKSDRAIITFGEVHFGIPPAVLMEIHLRNEWDVPLFIEFVINEPAINDFDNLLSLCMHRDFATSSVFWLFILRDPSIYHGPFSTIFESSLLFKLLNVITSFPRQQP